ncbi:hypothetical protein VHEMI08776 [[Torrubiella] hemipterigena]|uniref:SCP domain-containing protein n=1 Tax=[Torrubiella] hemipterigena TaxID=1531966 RepID=A0A0A1TQD8_9HYPO|nr:hypothetical protein VHEMI08776 [[Torrubiella] hemipterigena]
MLLRTITQLGLILMIALRVQCTPANPNPEVVTVTVEAPIPTGEPSYSNIPLFTAAILNSTNTYRSQHNASSVIWNNTLALYASEYLTKVQCVFEHSGGPYGENIAIGYGTATRAVEAWGDERVDYDFDKGEFTEKTGHFTQLVWKDTTDVGCGRALCGHKGWFLACEYWPRGNVIGYFIGEVDKYTGKGYDPSDGPSDGGDERRGQIGGGGQGEVLGPTASAVNKPGLIFLGVVIVCIAGLGTIS